MSWVIFVISAILVGAGALSIVTGAPVIQLERGWAEVIAGTVALSGGCVMVALGLVAVRLGAIQQALQAGADRPTASADLIAADGLRHGPARAAPITAPAPPVLDVVPMAEVPADESTALAEPPARQGLWKRVRRSEDAASPTEPPDAAQPIAADLRPIIPVVPPAEPLIVPRPAKEDSPRPPAFGSSPAKPSNETGISWLDEELSPAQAERASPAMRPSVIDEAPPVAPEPRLDGAAEAAPTGAGSVTVVGQFQAGVASYVMYSDGTIDVVSEGETVRRFASMDELKAFINEREASEP